MIYSDFSILVNTTDSFSDCWHPFFRLFKEYWPDYNGKIYLNTETKEFKYEGLNIIPVKNNLINKPWSECLQYAINQIEDKHFIYMQEDYFLHSKVNHNSVLELYDLFKNDNFGCLHLTDQCTKGPFNINTVNENLWEIKKGADYRASTQAAFWRKESILEIIRPWESGWDFEKFGTIRSCKSTSKIMCVNQDVYKKDINELIPYVFTGIIKGKWKKEVVPLFKENQIEIDYKNRGLVEKKDSVRVLSKVNTFINIILKYLKNYLLEINYQKNKN